MNPLLTLLAWLRSGEVPRPATRAESEALLEAAEDQGLSGLLSEAVARDRHHWPDQAVATLSRRRLVHLRRGILQLDVAARVHDRLHAAGIRSLPLKGAALLEMLYETAADRPMADVDILVLGNWSAGAALLQDDGFVVQERADHAVALREPETGVLVELHNSPASCPGLHPFDADALWHRRERRAGQVLVVPGPEDQLVFLATHAAFQHGLALSVVQYLDVQRLLMSRPPDPGQALDIARAAGACGAVALTLAATEMLLGPAGDGALAATFAPSWPSGGARLVPSSPHQLLAGSPRVLARTRWALSRGRRLTLLRKTLAGPRQDAGLSPWKRASGVVQRTGRLVMSLAA